VHDTGIGIPPEEIPQLFSRFYRGKRAQLEAYNGAGLGLYVARMIVEAHNGHLGVESQSGQGSLFWFALPVADSQSMMNQPAI
jgi:signal transduction histidine kinase